MLGQFAWFAGFSTTTEPAGDYRCNEFELGVRRTLTPAHGKPLPGGCEQAGVASKAERS